MSNGHVYDRGGPWPAGHATYLLHTIRGPRLLQRARKTVSGTVVYLRARRTHYEFRTPCNLSRTGVASVFGVGQFVSGTNLGPPPTPERTPIAKNNHLLVLATVDEVDSRVPVLSPYGRSLIVLTLPPGAPLPCKAPPNPSVLAKHHRRFVSFASRSNHYPISSFYPIVRP